MTPAAEPMSTRDRILDVAVESFLATGYANSRMTEIARQVGISRAALYKYFPDKRALLLGLNERVINDAEKQGVAQLLQPGSAAQRIGDWLRDNLRSQWRHNAVRVVTLEETQGALADDSVATQAILANIGRVLESTIRAGIRSGEFRAGLKPKEAAYAIQSLLLGLHRNNVSLRPILEIRGERPIHNVVDILVSGLLK